MEVPVEKAKRRFSELVRRAEAGEKIVPTRHGHPVARLTAIHGTLAPGERLGLLEAVSFKASAKATEGPAAARSQDYLYNEDGLPE